ncbi:unnamed protein product [Rotaria sp. Silwood1]|nr:unnamed protein product [Rotaria sp. Silwood1]
MVDRNNGGYVSGRGIPSYLLDRVDDNSSIYSDGASRIFREIDSLVTTSRGSYTSNISNIPYSSSSFTIASVDGISTSLLGSELNSSQQRLNCNISSVSNKTDETTTIRSDYPSTSDNRLINVRHEKVNEVSMLSYMSLMDTACSIPICLRKDDEQNASVVYSSNGASNVFTDPDHMFPPYVSLLSQEEDETE